MKRSACLRIGEGAGSEWYRGRVFQAEEAAYTVFITLHDL